MFPELKDNEKKIKAIIKEEEASFENTLAKGYERFRKAADAVKENGGAILSGQDTYENVVQKHSKLKKEVGH